jgi:uncharacterized protein (TIGR03067 family)
MLQIARRVFLIIAGSLLMGSLSFGADAPDTAKLQGKWETKKTNRQGQKVTQVLEIKKHQLIFKVFGEDDQVHLYAIGEIKTEKLGPFNVLKVTNIKAGDSESEAEAIDDDRAIIYQLVDDQLTLAANLDKERDDQPPSLDIYKKK